MYVCVCVHRGPDSKLIVAGTLMFSTGVLLIRGLAENPFIHSARHAGLTCTVAL